MISELMETVPALTRDACHLFLQASLSLSLWPRILLFCVLVLLFVLPRLLACLLACLLGCLCVCWFVVCFFLLLLACLFA